MSDHDAPLFAARADLELTRARVRDAISAADGRQDVGTAAVRTATEGLARELVVHALGAEGCGQSRSERERTRGLTAEDAATTCRRKCRQKCS